MESKLLSLSLSMSVVEEGPSKHTLMLILIETGYNKLLKIHTIVLPIFKKEKQNLIRLQWLKTKCKRGGVLPHEAFTCLSGYFRLTICVLAKTCSEWFNLISCSLICLTRVSEFMGTKSFWVFLGQPYGVLKGVKCLPLLPIVE